MISVRECVVFKETLPVCLIYGNSISVILIHLETSGASFAAEVGLSGARFPSLIQTSFFHLQQHYSTINQINT